MLAALTTTASELRSKLGESSASLQRFDAPLDQVTTPSLEALHAWSLASQAIKDEDFTSAVSSLQRALSLDPNFAVAIDENYWRQRAGVVTLAWDDRPALRDDRLNELVPTRSAIFKGPLTLVSEPKNASEVAARMIPEGATTRIPALIMRSFGKGRVAYFAAAADAALWSYAYPYQRRLCARALEWAANHARTTTRT